MDFQNGGERLAVRGDATRGQSSDSAPVLSAAGMSAADEVVLSAGKGLERLTDEELLELSRQGNRAAYSLMWTRHSTSGLRSARYFASELDAHDLVAEAYSRIFLALTRGGGPQGAFRTYLQVTIRNIANKWRNEQRGLVDLDSAEEDNQIEGVDDGVDSRADRALMRVAFASLPESWQEVLWCTEVLDLKPQAIASKMDLTPNSISALAFRAREGLRKAWIRAHLGEDELPKECADTLDRLPAYILGDQTPQRSRKVSAHLDICERCSRIRKEADLTASRLHTVVLPLMLTGGIGAGILGALTAAPSSASAASFTGATAAKATAVKATAVKATAVKATALGGSKLALLAGAGALTVGVGVAAAMWMGGAPQQEVPSAEASSLEQVQQSDDKPTQSNGEPVERDEAVGRDDWTGAPDDAETAALYSVPVVAEVDAPQYSFSENTVFATSAPLLTGYAAPGATVTLFVSNQDDAAEDGYVKLTTQVTGAGSWSANSESIPDGMYMVRAYQQLGDGTRSDTETRLFSVDNGMSLPVPAIVSVDNANNQLLPVVTGTGVPGAIVSVLINGVPNEGAIAADGTWSVTAVRGGVVGTNSLTVRQRGKSNQAMSGETTPLQFELVAPDVALDSSGADPVIVVSALPQSSVLVTDGQAFTHRLTGTQATNRIRLINNSGSNEVAETHKVSVVYVGEGGRRVGAPVLRQLEW